MAEFIPKSLSKCELHALTDTLLDGDSHAIAHCIQFVISETRGLWHGRARAKMCRRLKHTHLSRDQRDQLVRCIANRLINGQFSEQFRDQLRLAMQLNPQYMIRVAEQSAESEMRHIARLSSWLIIRSREREQRLASTPTEQTACGPLP